MTAILALTALLAFTAAARAQTGPRGADIARAIVQTWNCQDQLGQPRTRARNPWKLKHHSVAYRQWLLGAWRLRYSDCRETLEAKKREWNWQRWLPAKWYRIGSCETGYGGDPNWHHNSGAYQGAFGFAVSSWDAFKLPGYPDEAYDASPWQQYQVALAIWRRYGFSGWGCRNA